MPMQKLSQIEEKLKKNILILKSDMLNLKDVNTLF